MVDGGPSGAVDVRETIVEITVSDLSRSREWYSRLLGKGPDLEPFPGNVEFKIGGAWLQIVEGEVKSSSWSLQIEVRDLSRERERLRTVGVEVTDIKTVPNVIDLISIKDPDESSLLFFQVLTSDPKVTGAKG
jgi:hypothetical protein